MTERQPRSDQRAQDQDQNEVSLDSANVARPAGAHGYAGAVAVANEPEGPIGRPELATSDTELTVAYEAGVAPKARSQWAYARIRFFRHKLAVLSLIVLVLIGLVALFAERVAPYGFEYIPFTDAEALLENPNLIQESLNRPPQMEGKHLFGTDTLQNLPEKPRFVINATNVQTGSLWRFSREYMADYRIGRFPEPEVELAVAVGASSAFPPVLSPVRMKVDPNGYEQDGRGPLCRPP